MFHVTREKNHFGASYCITVITLVFFIPSAVLAKAKIVYVQGNENLQVS